MLWQVVSVFVCLWQWLSIWPMKGYSVWCGMSITWFSQSCKEYFKGMGFSKNGPWLCHSYLSFFCLVNKCESVSKSTDTVEVCELILMFKIVPVMSDKNIHFYEGRCKSQYCFTYWATLWLAQAVSFETSVFSLCNISMWQHESSHSTERQRPW